jgi:hypothetical protein
MVSDKSKVNKKFPERQEYGKLKNYPDELCL